MTAFARLLRLTVPALALLAAACSDHPSTATSTAPGVSPTAPNVNNPFATDALDPNMNPDYMRGQP